MQSTMEPQHYAQANQHEADAWLDYYGFSRDPFANDGVDVTCFMPTEWQQHLDLMKELLTHSSDLVLLQASHGQGKTALMTSFFNQLSGQYALCQVTASRDMALEDVLTQISQQLNLPTDSYITDNAQRLKELVEQLSCLHSQHLVIIDAVDQLSPDVLKNIIYLHYQSWQNHLPIRFLLSASDQFADHLLQLAPQLLTEDRLQIIEISPLSLQQIENYLLARLRSIDAQLDDIFSEDDIQHIYEWSEGVIGRINNVARQLLIEKMYLSDDVSDEPFWQQHQSKLIGGVVLLLLIVLGVMFLSHHHGDAVNKTSADEYALKLQTPTPSVTPEASAAESPTSLQQGLALPPIAKPAPKSSSIQTKPQPQARLNPRPKPRPSHPIVHKQVARKPRPSVTKPMPAHHHTVAHKASKGYTIQLLAVSRYDAVGQFLNAHRLPTPPRLHHQKRHGKDWYILTLGNYPNAHAAARALARLSPRIKALHPWVRRGM